jgi:hypothetical protein
MFKTAILSATALVLAGSVTLAAAPAQIGFAAHAFPIRQSDSFLPTIPAGLYPVNAQFGQLPTNYDGTDQWPCYGGGAECSSINSNGVVLGIPVYAWSLSACDNNAPPANPCGQIYFFYQDLTGDTTDDLIVTVTVKQGSNYIFAKGPVDIGPNPYYYEDVVFSGDKAFGTQGQTGKGNGWCAGSKHTCVDPVAGIANGEAIIQVGPYEMKEKFTINLQ